MELRPVEFPFKCLLSLESLIAYWDRVFEKGDPELVPPENFEFHGFGVFRAVDVTDQEVGTGSSRLNWSLVSSGMFFLYTEQPM